MDLKFGVLKSKVDTNKILEKMKLKDDRIAWIGINIEGTNAKVRIVEATQKPEVIDENEICNIVANKEGIVTKINVTNGTANVRKRRRYRKWSNINKWVDGRTIYWNKIYARKWRN